MIETVAAMAALIAAYLVYGRFRHSRNASDLLLLAALAFLSVTKFVVPVASGRVVENTDRFAAWAALVSSVIGAALLAASALVRERRLRRPVLAAQVLFAGLFAVAFMLALILMDLSDRLPLGLNPSTADASFPHFGASPACSSTGSRRSGSRAARSGPVTSSRPGSLRARHSPVSRA